MLVPWGDWHVPEQTTGNATRTRLTKTDACISVDTEHTAERFCMGHTAFNSSSLPTPDGQTYGSEREGGNITKKKRHECRTRVVQSHTDLEPLTLPATPRPACCRHIAPHAAREPVGAILLYSEKTR